MRRGLFVLVVLCGCYAPQPPQGAPCDDDHPCPVGQACVAGTCGGTIDAPGGNGSDDAMGSGSGSGMIDVDGDGVANAVDNCPTTANADQGNEDGDALGDPCDPCPIDPTTPPSDPDGDGVSDSCDPRPTQAGDSILVFEGFHNGVPTTWQVIGPVQQSGDDVVMTGVGGNRGALVPPVDVPANVTVSMKGKITGSVGNADSALAVVAPYEPNQDEGIYCELYGPNANSSNGRQIDIWDSIAAVDRASKPYSWQANTTYTLVERRAGNGYGCLVTPMNGGTESINGSTGSNPGASKAAVFTYGVSASIAWMMVVTSP
jgi:hypothetical protein